MKYFYIAWAALALLISFSASGLTDDAITHIGLLLFLGVTLGGYWLEKKWKDKKGLLWDVGGNPRRYFILWCTLYAALAEGFYMIARPVHQSLLITPGTAVVDMLRFYLIDLAFTVPAYLLIFYVMWRLLQKYNYSTWEFIFLMALGQALGDGMSTFFFAPALLLFIPYIMINYHVMHIVPFLKIKDRLPLGRSESKWRLVVAPLALFVTYFITGAAIQIIVKALGW